MNDPLLTSFLEGIRNGDKAARAALIDYLTERNDPRAEQVNQRDDRVDLLSLFSAPDYARRLRRRLEENGSWQSHLGVYTRQELTYPVLFSHYAIHFQEFPAIDEAGLRAFSSGCWHFVCRTPLPPTPASVQRSIIVTIALAVVEQVDARTVIEVRRGLFCAHNLYRGLEICLLYHAPTGQLHSFDQAPEWWPRSHNCPGQIALDCPRLINDYLRP